MDAPEVQEHAERIVEAIARRSAQDAGLSIEQVQNLLVLRVREEAEQLGIRPRALMGAVWRAWEKRDRPPLLGPSETMRVLERLAERGLLTMRRQGEGDPQVIWCGLPDDQVDARLAQMDPPLSHEERLFVEGIRRHLAARARGVWHSWEPDRP